MRIKLAPNTRREDELYAIKDRSTNQYLTATWASQDRNRCNWYGFDSDVSKIAKDRAQALKRFNSVLDLMRSHIDSVTSQPPSWWRDDNLAMLHRLLSGDLVLVKIEFTMDVKEFPA